LSSTTVEKNNVTQPPFFRLLHGLWQHLSRHRQFQFGLVLVLMLISTFADVLSLGTVLPFLGILTAPEKVFSYPMVPQIARLLGITSAADLVLPLTVMFAVTALVAGALRLLLLRASTQVAYGSGADLSVEVYRRTLYQPYRVHVSRNSSVVISGITHKVGIATNVLWNVLSFISSATLLAAIVVTLFSINALIASVTAIGFGTCYLLISLPQRWRLDRNSKIIAQESTRMIKALQEGLGGIRDVLLDGTQPLYCEIYRTSQIPLMRSHGSNQFIGGSPRCIMESFGMILVAALAYGLSRQAEGVSHALPLLGTLAAGAQRLLPALQQCYGAWASIAGNRASLVDALELLDQPLATESHQVSYAPLEFTDAISFENVRFRYSSDGPWVLDGLNITITKGIRIGFVGSTGGGKSTTLDLLMGLLEPTYGRIMVDGWPIIGERLHSWQKKIAHVPQNIYLADTTLAENIAFGIPREAIDLDRVRQAAFQAHISDFIESMPEGYQAFVGERGVRLSGGQRQRIGIARALYKHASVLVFDEATSALDNATERSVMDAIEELSSDLTIMLIAHRLTTVQRCDTIVELENGKVVAQGTYEQLLEDSPSFRRMAMTEA